MTPGSKTFTGSSRRRHRQYPPSNDQCFFYLQQGNQGGQGENPYNMASHGQIDNPQSCNIVFAELAMELGKEDKMTTEAEKMGFGASFVIDGIPTLALITTFPRRHPGSWLVRHVIW